MRQAAQAWSGGPGLRCLAGILLELTAHDQVEELVGSAELDIGAHLDGVHPLQERVQELHDRDGRAGGVALGEVVPLEHLGDGDLRGPWNEGEQWEFVNDRDEQSAVDGGDGTPSVKLPPTDQHTATKARERTDPRTPINTTPCALPPSPPGASAPIAGGARRPSSGRAGCFLSEKKLRSTRAVLRIGTCRRLKRLRSASGIEGSRKM